jgi:hypothetical protein
MKHCSSCGKPHHNTDDSYSTCCNEWICDESHTSMFGFHGNWQRSVKSCCWGKASKLIKVESMMCRW